MSRHVGNSSCIVCGFELRGLPRTGSCPECGSAVERSFGGEWLRFAEQHWLSRVHLGMQIVRWCAVAVLAVIALEALSAIAGTSLWHFWMRAMPLAAHAPTGPVLAAVALLAWSATMMLGLWLMTTGEPRLDAGHTWRTALLRVVGLAMPVMACVVFANELDLFGPQVGPATRSALRYLPVILVVVHGVTMVDLLHGFERRCRSMAERPRSLIRRIRAHARSAAIFIALLYGLAAVASGGPMHPGVFLLLWVVAIGPTRSLVDAVSQERIASSRIGS